jgi:hypothetical protein
MQEQPKRQAIRQFLDFMRIGDTDSAYQAVEKMNFSDFVDALEAVHAKEKSQKASKRSAADTQHGQMKSKGHDRSRHKEIRPGIGLV